MKKLSAMAVCMFLLLSLCACGGSRKPSDDKETEPEGNVVINGFEEYAPDFQLLRPLSVFGTVDVNTDRRFVKSGNSSAKLRPLRNSPNNSLPRIYYPLCSETFGFDYGDLKKIRNISAEIYNAEAEPLDMTMAIVMEAVNVDMVHTSALKRFVLEPGWNTVAYAVDVNILNILYDPEKAQGVLFEFAGGCSRDIEDAPTLYLDDISVLFAAKPAEIEEVLSFDRNEICSFDKLYQKYVITTDIVDPACYPDMEVIDSAKKYSISPTSGKFALEIVTHPGTMPDWPRIVIPEKIMKKSDFSKVPKSEWGSTYFCYDMYAMDYPENFYPEFFDSGYGTCYNKWANAAQKGKWTTFRIKLTELTKDMVQTPGFFRLAWYGPYDRSMGSRRFLIDSFRIEHNG